MNFNVICYGERRIDAGRGVAIELIRFRVFLFREIKRPEGIQRSVNKVADDPIKIFPSTSSAPHCNHET